MMNSSRPMPNADAWVPPPDSRAPELRRLYIAVMTISSFIVLMRICTRAFIKALGWDDLVAVASLTLSLAWTALKLMDLPDGVGTHIAEVPPQKMAIIGSKLTTTELLFVFSMCVVRFAILAFFFRLSKDKWFVRGIYAVGFLVFAITLIPVAFILSKCKDVRDLWNISNPKRQCGDFGAENNFMLAHGAVGVVIDISLLALPISVVFRKMKFSGKMVRVIGIFCVGIFSLVAGILRLIYSNLNFDADITWNVGVVSLWGVIEVHFGLWAACFPALQPLLRFIGDKMPFSKKRRSSQSSTSSRKNPEKPLVASSEARSSNVEP